MNARIEGMQKIVDNFLSCEINKSKEFSIHFDSTNFNIIKQNFIRIERNDDPTEALDNSSSSTVALEC